METLAPKSAASSCGSRSSSSGNSTNSSSMDIKTSKGNGNGNGNNNNNNNNGNGGESHKLHASRSRSFLHCLGKHLGRHFLPGNQHRQHQHRRRHYHDAMIYNSQDDIRSSSTDTFSLSFERGSHITGSSIDLTTTSATISTDEHTSRASSSSASCSRFSPALCASTILDVDALEWTQQQQQQQQQRPLYGRTAASNQFYRRTYSLDNQDQDDNENDNNDDNDDDVDNNGDDENGHRDELSSDEYDRNDSSCASHYQVHNSRLQLEAAGRTLRNSTNTSGRNPPPQRSTSTVSKGLQLSRISITSSVSRMLHHFSSTRSLSCSNTPLRRSKDNKQQTKGNNFKSSPTTKSNASTASSTNCSNPTKAHKKGHSSLLATTKWSSSYSVFSAVSASSTKKKKEKKQQSILRPPVHYVYMKGMSGLYSRVPRYTVCCPYAMQQFA